MKTTFSFDASPYNMVDTDVSEDLISSILRGEK
jgi:hypothetical protein